MGVVYKSAAVAVAALAAVSGSVEGKKLKVGMTWANIAWGFGYQHKGFDTTDGADVVFLDMDAYSKQEIKNFKQNGHLVSCYMSVGTLEKHRDDYRKNKKAWNNVVVSKQDGWDEEWLDIQKPDELMDLMIPRLERAKFLGCDIVECDNVDCYENPSCYGPLGYKDDMPLRDAQVDYIKRLAKKAHNLGLEIISKNAVTLQPRIWNMFDGCITESCVRFNECKEYGKWCTKKGKPHFNADYLGASTCKQADKYPDMMTKWCEKVGNSALCSSQKNDEWRECWTDASSGEDNTPTDGKCSSYNKKDSQCWSSDSNCYYNYDNDKCIEYEKFVCKAATKAECRSTSMCKNNCNPRFMKEIGIEAQKCRQFVGKKKKCRNNGCVVLDTKDVDGNNFCVPSDEN